MNYTMILIYWQNLNNLFEQIVTCINEYFYIMKLNISFRGFISKWQNKKRMMNKCTLCVHLSNKLFQWMKKKYMLILNRVNRQCCQFIFNVLTHALQLWLPLIITGESKYKPHFSLIFIRVRYLAYNRKQFTRMVGRPETSKRKSWVGEVRHSIKNKSWNRKKCFISP